MFLELRSSYEFPAENPMQRKSRNGEIQPPQKCQFVERHNAILHFGIRRNRGLLDLFQPLKQAVKKSRPEPCVAALPNRWTQKNAASLNCHHLQGGLAPFTSGRWPSQLSNASNYKGTPSFCHRRVGHTLILYQPIVLYLE